MVCTNWGCSLSSTANSIECLSHDLTANVDDPARRPQEHTKAMPTKVYSKGAQMQAYCKDPVRLRFLSRAPRTVVWSALDREMLRDQSGFLCTCMHLPHPSQVSSVESGGAMPAKQSSLPGGHEGIFTNCSKRSPVPGHPKGCLLTAP